MNAPQLENDFVKLTLLDLGNYEQLSDIANQKDLLYYSSSDISSPEKLKDYVQLAVTEYEQNIGIPFLVYDKVKQQYAGSTRFNWIDHTNKVLHIGWTWIGREFQSTGLNKNMKFLMLQYAFETLEFEKVEFRIDERNSRSRKAVEKIGGTPEGILRKTTLMLDGFRRSTCCYGILKEEWNGIKSTIFEGFN